MCTGIKLKLSAHIKKKFAEACGGKSRQDRLLAQWMYSYTDLKTTAFEACPEIFT